MNWCRRGIVPVLVCRYVERQGKLFEVVLLYSTRTRTIEYRSSSNHVRVRQTINDNTGCMTPNVILQTYRVAQRE